MSARWFPLDIEAVHQYGTDAWQRACVWPVSEPAFAALCDRVEQMYARAVNDHAGTTVAAALLVKRTLVIEYYHFLHAILAIERLRSAGWEPRCTASAPWYHHLLADALDARPHGFAVKTLVPGMRRTVRGDVVRAAKCVAWTIRLRAAAGKPLFSARHHETFVSLGVPSEQSQTYVAQSPGRLSVSWVGEWIPNGIASLDNRTLGDCATTAETLTSALRGIAQESGIALTSSHVRYLQRLTEHHLIDAATTLCSVRLRRPRGERLLLSTPGDQFGRVLALALRPFGLSVTSVAHGGSLGLFDSYTMSVNEFAVSDEFVAMTEGSAALFRRILDAHPPLGGNRVTIVAGAYSRYHRVYMEHRSSPPPRFVRTVMLVGGSYAPWRRPQGTGQFPFLMLHVELEILRVLQGAGYAVVYKAHPDRLREASLLFGDRVAIIGGDLNACLDRANAFVFSTIRTTAFPLALCTTKPVVGFLVEPDRYPLFPDVRALLTRRCAFVPLQFDERGQLAFDDRVLVDAIVRPPAPLDPAFVEQILSPPYAATHPPRDIYRDSTCAR